MLLGPVFARFAAKSPISVTVQGTLEYALTASQLDSLFEAHTQGQYTRTLLFSTVVDLLSQVVCGVRKSVHAAFQAADDSIPVSLTSVYNKLNGIEPQVAAELVRHSAGQLGPVVGQLGGTLAGWVKGYQVRILDGNHLAATEHRLGETRRHSAGPLPGMALAVLDPELMMVTDVFPCEDGHAQERSLLDQVAATLRERQLWLADRNFCTRAFLLAMVAKKACFVIREHANLNWESAGRLRSRGRIDGARVREQRVAIRDDQDNKVFLRRVTLELDEPTRDGDTALAVLTNLPEEAASAGEVGRLYRRRWTIEGAFQELARDLRSEIAPLCYPRAALFAFCVGLLAYNVLAVVKGALRATHGEKAVEEVSGYYLADEIGGTRRGMMIAVEEKHWRVFRAMTQGEFVEVLRELASKVRMAAFRRHRRGPKKPAVKRKHNRKHPHVATSRLLDKRNPK
ncbi:MAG TPA: IS4 family transposase [Gemmataceae bacterium]|nr:IS4 family transposase [Gemmataceae bacterium]